MPEAAKTTFLLMHLSKVNPEKDVPNPFKGDRAKYQKCFETMQEAIENLFRQVAADAVIM